MVKLPVFGSSVQMAALAVPEVCAPAFINARDAAGAKSVLQNYMVQERYLMAKNLLGSPTSEKAPLGLFGTWCGATVQKILSVTACTDDGRWLLVNLGESFVPTKPTAVFWLQTGTNQSTLFPTGAPYLSDDLLEFGRTEMNGMCVFNSLCNGAPLLEFNVPPFKAYEKPVVDSQPKELTRDLFDRAARDLFAFPLGESLPATAERQLITPVPAKTAVYGKSPLEEIIPATAHAAAVERALNSMAFDGLKHEIGSGDAVATGQLEVASEAAGDFIWKNRTS